MTQPLDRMLFLVICADRNGTEYVAERNVSDMCSERTLRDIASGELRNVSRVIVFNPVEHICTDMTEDFARTVMNVWASGGEPLTDRQRDFIEQHIGVQAANSFRRVA